LSSADYGFADDLTTIHQMGAFPKSRTFLERNIEK